jgi:hypothetical protein
MDRSARTLVSGAVAVRGNGLMPPSCGASAARTKSQFFDFLPLYLLAPTNEKAKAALLQSCDGDVHEHQQSKSFGPGIAQP